MAGMGPAPKPAHQRARRNATVAMTALPAEGRLDPAPEWPLSEDVRLLAEQGLHRAEVRRLQRELRSTEDGRVQRKLQRAIGRERERLALVSTQITAQRELELAVWAQVWATPQAVQWQRMRWTREVATYVRLRVLGELGDLAAGKEARQYSDRLGLSPLAMMRLRWSIVTDEVAAKRAEHEPAGDAPSTPTAEAVAVPVEAESPFAALRAV